jgi:transposase
VRGNKHEVVQPQMRFATPKTVAQQDVQALHRLRERRMAERTALCNQLRGLLGEYGIVLPRGVASLRRRVPELLEAADNGLSGLFRRLLGQAYRQLQELDAHIAERLQTIPGYGPILASVFYSAVGDGAAYRRGRDVSAGVGLVPRQHSSGGREQLLGISKRGDRYLRSLLVHGARSVVRQAAGKQDRLSRWVNRIRAERGYNKAVVALANKLARIGWAVLAHHTTYQAA